MILGFRTYKVVNVAMEEKKRITLIDDSNFFSPYSILQESCNYYCCESFWIETNQLVDWPVPFQINQSN